MEPLDSDAGCDPDCSDAADDGPDGARLEVELNSCPDVALEVTPVRARLDQPIRVASRTQDADGDALTYLWLAEPDGAFDAASEPLTSYRCASLGRKMLQLIATDERGCEAIGEVEVSCVDAAAP